MQEWSSNLLAFLTLEGFFLIACSNNLHHQPMYQPDWKLFWKPKYELSVKKHFDIIFSCTKKVNHLILVFCLHANFRSFRKQLELINHNRVCKAKLIVFLPVWQFRKKKKKQPEPEKKPNPKAGNQLGPNYQPTPTKQNPNFPPTPTKQYPNYPPTPTKQNPNNQPTPSPSPVPTKQIGVKPKGTAEPPPKDPKLAKK